MNRLHRRPVDWDAYLARFHAVNPGITEAVLARCHYHDTTPYQWLVDGIPNTASILDLGCGNAPTFQPDVRRWIGIDRCAAELVDAQIHGAHNVALGDATRLPIAAATFDTVICAMTLMLLTPLTDALREIHRVLQPHGTVHVLLPTTRPLTWTDRARFASLSARLHTAPRFPNSPLRHHAGRAFTQAGFRVTDDERRRYLYPVHATNDADRLVDSLYLPHLHPDRLTPGRAQACRWTGTTVGIPLRKITALRLEHPENDQPRGNTSSEHGSPNSVVNRRRRADGPGRCLIPPTA